MTSDVYKGPLVTAQSAADGLTAEQKSQARVFDVASGTGMCGQQVNRFYTSHLKTIRGPWLFLSFRDLNNSFNFVYYKRKLLSIKCFMWEQKQVAPKLLIYLLF